MSHPVDRDAIVAQQRKDRRRQKLLAEQQRADVQQIMNLPAGRRVVWQFLQDVGVDASPFATNAMAQSHAIGLQDAAKWWLNAIREHCPEKESQMRRDIDRVPEAPNEEDDHEH